MLNGTRGYDIYETLRRYCENKNERTDYERLIGKHADINAQDSQGRTALHYAACFNDTNMAELLLDARADINAQDNMGRTALHYAACFNNTDMVELLLDAGAKTDIKDNNGKKPSSFTKNKEIIDLLKGLPARCLSNVMASCFLA
ncbi:MAG: ankyrin repeat domain-containing protein, partial [Wolbachia endosymbiont of Alcedoecus sp.]|nr:ankyrin repeat domain-containing protein [Wolbachia endosymbiont of Alcedoecus sp.]